MHQKQQNRAEAGEQDHTRNSTRHAAVAVSTKLLNVETYTKFSRMETADDAAKCREWCDLG